MVRRLGFWILAILGVAVPAMAGSRPASLRGYVRSTAGVPQMGATVEVLSATALNFKAFTDDRGFFTISDLIPGTYSIKVSAPSFLPTWRDRITLHEGAAAVVNLTLNTLFEGLQLGPPRTSQDDDDWKWTMRSTANRPVLRMLPDGTVVVAMATGFAVEHPVFGTDAWTMEGNVGYSEGAPSAILRTGFTHHLANGSEPTVALTIRHFAPPPVGLPTTGFEAVSLTTTDNLTFGNVLELKFGSELQTIQFMGRITAFQPFGTADLHLSPDTVLEYAYTTSRPPCRAPGESVAGAADLAGTGPRISIASFAPALERAHHQEVSLSRRFGKTNLQVALFSDQVSNTVLTGVGEVTAGSGELLPDVTSGTFSYQGKDLDTQGVRVVLQRKLRSDLTATVDYGYGGVLDLPGADVELHDARGAMTIARRHAVAGKLSGRLPHAKTQWAASYGWTSGQALTPVDLFNASPGQSDPFLNLYLRQPLPGIAFLPIHMEAMLDLRNLLAQGYVPVMGQDGRTVYLVQSARAVRGGLAFVF